MAASFTPDCSTVTLDASVRDASLSQLQTTQALAASVLDQANDAAVDLTSLSFPTLSVTVDYDTTGQLPSVTTPDPPSLDDVDLEVTTPPALGERTPEPDKPGLDVASVTPGTIDNLPTRPLRH